MRLVKIQPTTEWYQWPTSFVLKLIWLLAKQLRTGIATRTGISKWRNHSNPDCRRWWRRQRQRQRRSFIVCHFATQSNRQPLAIDVLCSGGGKTGEFPKCGFSLIWLISCPTAHVSVACWFRWREWRLLCLLWMTLNRLEMLASIRHRQLFVCNKMLAINWRTGFRDGVIDSNRSIVKA